MNFWLSTVWNTLTNCWRTPVNPESITTAAQYDRWMKSLPVSDDRSDTLRKQVKAVYAALPPDEKRAVRRGGMEVHFTPEKRGKSTEELSPSGKYKLVITSYETKPGCWSYTGGEVFRQSDGALVADVWRNYSSFPFCWMENHVNGHDYLICGEDYQGQTFCELDTGKIKHLLSDGTDNGFGFCWSSHELLPDGITLKVCGCHWACPCEYRLYDVSDPMAGWPELEKEVELDEGDNTTLTVEGEQVVWRNGDKTWKATGQRYREIERLQMDAYRVLDNAKKAGVGVEEAQAAYDKLNADFPEEDEDADKWGKVIDHEIRLQRVGDKLAVVSEWKSEHKLEWERGWAEHNAKWKADTRRWQDESELWQWLAQTVGGREVLHPRSSWMQPSMNARDAGDNNRAYFIVRTTKDYDLNRLANIEWGVTDGPVTLKLWVRGKGDIAKPEFPRTVEGIQAAWARAAEHTGGAS